VGLVGSVNYQRSGAISLAHRGVLFLDELQKP
jgi:predicted ATPase with chaperone activity